MLIMKGDSIEYVLLVLQIESISLVYYIPDEWSAVGAVGCRVHLAPGPWFEFPALGDQVFHSLGVGELVTDSSGKNKTLNFPSAGHLSHSKGQIPIRIASTTSRGRRMWRIQEGID